jgi:hypothetical protein
MAGRDDAIAMLYQGRVLDLAPDPPKELLP